MPLLNVLRPAIVWAPVVKTPLILALALGIAAIFVVLPPTTNVAVGPALVPFIQAQLAALAKLVPVLAVPVKLPLNVPAKVPVTVIVPLPSILMDWLVFPE